MGVRFPSVQSNTFVGPLPANANETVVLTTPPLTLPLDFATVFLFWTCDITPGTGVSTHVWRLRRGATVAGALVNASQFNTAVTAGIRLMSSGVYFDTPGAVTGQQYSLTIVQTNASAGGIFADGALLAFVL